MFYDVCDDIDGLSDTVSSNISFFVDSIKVVNYQNEKRGVTKEIKQVINKKKKIFYTGYPPEKKAISRELRSKMPTAKMKYRTNSVWLLPNSFRCVLLISSSLQFGKPVAYFEKFEKRFFCPVDCKLNPSQFSYPAGKSVEDTKVFILILKYTSNRRHFTC